MTPRTRRHRGTRRATLVPRRGVGGPTVSHPLYRRPDTVVGLGHGLPRFHVRARAIEPDRGGQPMLAAVRSAVLEGVDGRVVTVEIHVSRGLPGYTVVGLPDTAGRESRERVRAAIL